MRPVGAECRPRRSPRAVGGGAKPPDSGRGPAPRHGSRGRRSVSGQRRRRWATPKRDPTGGGGWRTQRCEVSPPAERSRARVRPPPHPVAGPWVNPPPPGQTPGKGSQRTHGHQVGGAQPRARASGLATLRGACRRPDSWAAAVEAVDCERSVGPRRPRPHFGESAQEMGRGREKLPKSSLCRVGPAPRAQRNPGQFLPTRALFFALLLVGDSVRWPSTPPRVVRASPCWRGIQPPVSQLW